MRQAHRVEPYRESRLELILFPVVLLGVLFALALWAPV